MLLPVVGIANKIGQRLAADPEFRSLCQDYEQCALALERWRQVSEASPDRVAEYTQLLEELGDEIREVLDSEA